MTHERPNEHSPLLSPTGSTLCKKRQPTPLPYLQISVVLLLQICEPITSMSIYPYINQLISELDITGGDERKVGYYAGLIESLFFATEALTVLQWSRTSDVIGRKPVLLIGIGGTVISMLLFGFSRTFWALVISRCLAGLLNGNIGVMKSTMGDLTDSTNRAEGFAGMPVVWAFGATVGPLLGGTLARPHERFPQVFGAPFWDEFPYLLPCIATSCCVLVIFGVTALFFKESAPIKKKRRSHSPEATLVAGDYFPDEGPLPLRKLLTYPVVISVSNYVALAFLNIGYNALFPLFCAMPLDIGGIDLPPATIGYIMGSYGCFTGIFQFFFFAKVVRRFGERRVFLNGITAFIGLFSMFPIISTLAQQYGVNWMTWVLISVMILFQTAMDMAYGAIFMFVTSSAPNKRSLGATNGLSQMIVSISRAIGPALATSLFSLSVEENYLGGYAVHLFFVFLSLLSLTLGVRLPQKVWDADESNE